MDETPRLFINSFVPLVCSAAGRVASDRYKLPPFIDGSIRREPDLEHKYPSISCLCRAGKFAPRLRVGDHVIYFTAKRRYGAAPPQRLLIAVLKVIESFDTHAAAAQWYRSKGMKPPSNCMLKTNPSKPLEQSHQLMTSRGCGSNEKLRSAWDAEYWKRVEQHQRFHACDPVFLNLCWNAPVVHDDALKSVFHKIPGTQNPGAYPLKKLNALMKQLKLPALPSSRRIAPIG